MSYPPTEADVISNDSLFSDSAEFDAAEKPFAAEDSQGIVDACDEPLSQNDRGVSTNDDMVQAGSRYPKEEPAAPPPPPPVTNAFMKPRKTATQPPQKWIPVDLQVPEDDAADEFDIGTARTPVYESPADPSATGSGVPPKVQFVNGEPDSAGEVTNCFEEPGLLYRIVDRPNKTWAFYNDSRSFEVHVVCTFGKHSKITPLENATMTRDESTGEHVVEVTVYPGETEPFIKGFVNGFASKLSALPLSQEYFTSRSRAQNEQIVQAEMDAIRAIAGDETDAERILHICLEHNLPFVDLSFPPSQSSIEAGASKPFKQLPWGRPRMYVKPEMHDQIRLFRHDICPGKVEQGELGDCWLMCALATQAEDPKTLMRMFRHPKGAGVARVERAIGAYRVSFNKNGLWRNILVDDYLPVVAGVPTFAHSSDPCELWPGILEKAFAKMHGSYAMIQSGDPMHALTDMTGFSTMRIDEMFASATLNSGRDLLPKMMQWQKKGYQAVLTTAGKAPAITTDAQGSPDFSDQPEMEEAFSGTGLLPGHAYTMLDVKEFNKGQIRLICVRNPWVYGSGWTRPWGWGAPEWQQHRDIAAACGFSKHRSDRSVVWMAFEDALKYFIGGGVLFRVPAVHDARVPITFTDCHPGAVFQISVRAPVGMVFLLSNMDHRGMHVDEVGAADSDANNMDYPPVMLSLAAPVPGETDVYHVVLNSSTDMTQPSDSAWLFLQAREIAMRCHLEPSSSPYLLIPRLMEADETTGNGDGEDMRDVVHPIHYFNDYDHLFPNAASAGAKEVAVTVGFQTGEDSAADVTVAMLKMSGGNAVFENFPKFPTDDVEPHAEALYFQTKASSCGYAQEKAGITLY
ncbi:hypothetical protein LSCM1_07434 [Leishmania martiniquensis]|uniref:Calpain catalytic domain-containing protein n=1 Tax=Leishmania martiniquensis TaxID=1580590 RepID=A0A836H9U0_9TRYP|nr:hypothetical protein LSCM1_07434 [Leishmania martiniquensis]